MVQMAQRSYSLEEYFCVEEMHETKYEYFAGSIYAMAGASVSHNRIAGNIFAALHTALQGSPCEPFGSDQRIRTPAGLYTYPDDSVICGDLEYSGDRLETVTNPVALFEVLSDSTRQYDGGDKFEFYRAIPTLRDYVLVEQAAVLVEHRYRSADDEWTTTVLTDLNDVLELPALPFRVALRAIYDRVEFTSAGPPTP